MLNLFFLKIPTSRMPNVELDVVAVTVGTFTEAYCHHAAWPPRNKCRAFQRVLGRKKADSRSWTRWHLRKGKNYGRIPSSSLNSFTVAVCCMLMYAVCSLSLSLSI